MEQSRCDEAAAMLYAGPRYTVAVPKIPRAMSDAFARSSARRVVTAPNVHMHTPRWMVAAMQPGRAFVSSRLPTALRDRLKAFAVASGESVQHIVERAVTRLLAEEAREPLALAAVLRTLRSMEEALRQEGVTGVWVFGSVACGDARPDNDVDLALEIDPGRRPSLQTLARP